MADGIRIEVEFVPARTTRNGTEAPVARPVAPLRAPPWLSHAVVACLAAVPASCAVLGWVAGSSAGGSAPLGTLVGASVGGAFALATLILSGAVRES